MLGTINVLEAARRVDGTRVVNTSTGGAIYGDADVIPTPETAPARPEAAYGQSKLAAEGYVGLYERLYGLSTVTLRYGNVYGPRQDPLGEAGVVAMFCGRLMLAARPTVYGDGLPDARLRLRRRRRRGQPGGRRPARRHRARQHRHRPREHRARPRRGDGRALRRPATSPPMFEPPGLGELMHSCLDVSRARDVLGWHATTELLEGLRQTMAATIPAPQA